MVLTVKDFEDFKVDFTASVDKCVQASVEKATAAATETMRATVAEAIAEAVKNAIAPLHNEIAELRELVHDTQEKVQSLQDKLAEKSQIINELEIKATTIADTNSHGTLRTLVAEKSDINEQYSRKECLRLEGIPFDETENNDSLKAAVINKLKEHDVDITQVDIHRLHRSGRPYLLNKYKEYANKRRGAVKQHIDKEDQSLTAQVIMRFTNWSARTRVYSLHYRNDATIGVKCDITKYRSDLLATSRNYLKDNVIKGYCYINSECHLVLKNVDANLKYNFTNFADFKFHADKLVRDENFHKKPDVGPEY